MHWFHVIYLGVSGQCSRTITQSMFNIVHRNEKTCYSYKQEID